VLTPVIADTAHLPADTPLGLGELEWLLMRALDELARHPLPQAAVHVGPDDGHQREPVDFVSFVVAHRAERLFQLVELAGAALDNLEQGSLLPSAITARSLFEIAATSDHVHRIISPVWRGVTGSSRVTDVATTNHELWDVLWKARLGTRVAGDDWPKAVNVMTRLGHFGRGDELFTNTVDSVYRILCDAAHPNMGSHDVFWRRGQRDRRGRQRVCLDPATSESPVKLAILNAVRISSKVVINYCRDLWWIAADLACACRFHMTSDTLELGLPQPTGRNEPCCCGSGIKSKDCSHPEPVPLSEEYAFAAKGFE
jgi:hypothetical protein